MITTCIHECIQFTIELDKFEIEIDHLISGHKEVEEKADETGKKIYDRWPPHPIHDPDADSKYTII